ncbi:HI1506-related protein [Epibacterium ulvae]|uniref:HI1506-related protein n=1 Tax=Epibacterium ulvae TaxID=1156985 RepID=UPI0024927394|nr:HI1506-related protein [Epibacterium ulvae]
MSKTFKVSGIHKQGFCRCGVHFPHEGRIVSEADFKAEDWARLRAEPNLRIELLKETAQDEDAAQDRKARIIDAIKSLDGEAFQADGAPKVGAINAALKLAGADIAKVTADEREEIWADMIATPPPE